MHDVARPRRLLSSHLTLALALALVVAGCGTIDASPTPSPTEAPLPAATFTGGQAVAAITAPDQATWAGGYCTRGANDAWLAINIGDLNGQAYFGLVIGADPHADPAASQAAGGGTFRSGAATVTWRLNGTRALITRDTVTVVAAPDLRSGTFSGTLADGRQASGNFSCP